MTEKSTIPRLFPDTFSIGQSELTGQYSGAVVRGRLFINDQHVSWGGTFNNGFFTYYVGPDRIKRQDKVELVGYDSENNELTRSVVTIKVETENALFKKNESLIRIQAERVDPISTKVVFFSHDRGTAKMYFKLDKDGAPQPLSNGTVVPICLEGGSETSDMGRFRHVYHAVIEDAAEGLVSIILKNNILGHQGRVDGSIYIKPPNDQQLDTAGRFLFHIERSPIDDMTGGADQFYYDGFHEISEKIAEVRRIVSDMTTEAQAEVNKKIADLEEQINRFLQDAQSKFTSLDSDITAVKETITALENRLTTVRNEIEALANSLEFGGRNYLRNSEAPRVANHSGSTIIVSPNQTVEEWRATNAVRHEVSGGTNTIVGTLSAGRTVTPNVRYVHSIFIKNIGTTNVRVNNNLGGIIIVAPGESKRIVFPAGGSATGVASMQFVFVRDRVEDNCDFILWRAMIAQGNIVGDWVPNPDELVLKNVVDISTRNLVPNSSFYNDTHGWAVNGHLTATSTGTYTRFVKAAVTATRATVSREVIDDRIKPGTEYTLGVMVYVESATVLANSSASTIFLRTNNGAMLDAPLGTIDWSRVGGWQLVIGTGTTRPGTWVNRPQITIAIGENTTCAIRVKEFVIVEGSKYLGWFPDSAEIAIQRHLEETQQKVQTLEQNTIRLTNQFPDPDFSKATPRPVAEGGIGINYNDGVGVVLNNPTAVQGRIYWGNPPLGLMVGKTYNVSMYLNAGGASAGRVFIAGTSTGDNFSFSVPNDSPVWVHGTIGLTNWSAFSVWLPPNTSLRIRELYIYEANTDITTARIERLEKDNSLPAISPTFDPRFISYSADNGIWHCQVERTGNIVALSGAIANTVAISTTGTEKILMARLPVGYRPKKTVNRVMAGSGTAIFNMEIDPTGEIYMARYRGATTSFTYAAVQFVGAWLNVGTTFLGEDI
ncbi:hypothetical protein YS9_2301 [Enterococcus sp. C1]|uniref:immunoglobulin-like domain-containing protein n=1 Tax=Enterococcus sp. C1 TaxID=1182762 RepID=UPI000271DCA2|nr:immunoglobulin-like domain-containing protein [Enterococcus sp. C1]EJF48918.1 hypothetical protein YS9_2301 [Enterococcus sp. C1]